MTEPGTILTKCKLCGCAYGENGYLKTVHLGSRQGSTNRLDMSVPLTGIEETGSVSEAGGDLEVTLFPLGLKL